MALLGFKVTYAPGFENNWDAIGAIGQWAGALVGILIPIAAIYIQEKLNSNKKDIGESNAYILNELDRIKTEIAKVLKDDTSLQPTVVDLKEQALKFVNISMITNTDAVAKHLRISKGEAYDILLELVRHDGAISSGGSLKKDNLDNIVWTKKRK